MFLKKLLIGVVLASVLSFASSALADTWVVCDPQLDADGYKYTMDASDWVTTPYEEYVYQGVSYALVANVENVAVGNHIMQVKAFLDTGVGGIKESAIIPFEFTKPREGWDGSIGSPTGLKLIPIP